MELLTLVCVCNILTSTADPVLPRRLLTDGVFAQTWRRRTELLVIPLPHPPRPVDGVLTGRFPLLFHFPNIFAPCRKGQRALCSIAGFL